MSLFIAIFLGGLMVASVTAHILNQRSDKKKLQREASDALRSQEIGLLKDWVARASVVGSPEWNRCMILEDCHLYSLYLQAAGSSLTIDDAEAMAILRPLVNAVRDEYNRQISAKAITSTLKTISSGANWPRG